MEAEGKGDTNAGRSGLGRGSSAGRLQEQREQAGFGEMKGGQSTKLWHMRKTVAGDKVRKVTRGRSCIAKMEFGLLFSVQCEATKGV